MTKNNLTINITSKNYMSLNQWVPENLGKVLIVKGFGMCSKEDFFYWRWTFSIRGGLFYWRRTFSKSYCNRKTPYCNPKQVLDFVIFW